MAVLRARRSRRAGVSDGWRLVGNTIASYTSKTLWQQTGFSGVLPDQYGKAYWLVNARVGMRSANDKYELAVFAKNLFNAGYTTFGGSTATYGNILIWGNPPAHRWRGGHGQLLIRSRSRASGKPRDRHGIHGASA